MKFFLQKGALFSSFFSAFVIFNIERLRNWKTEI